MGRKREVAAEDAPTIAILEFLSNSVKLGIATREKFIAEGVDVDYDLYRQMLAWKVAHHDQTQETDRFTMKVTKLRATLSGLGES